MNLSTLTLKTHYRTGYDNPVDEFYIPCLKQSILYRRASGYFSSHIFDLVGQDVLHFAKNGGRIKLICSPKLDVRDIQVLTDSYQRRIEYVNRLFASEIDFLLSDNNIDDRSKLILGTLVRHNILDVKIAWSNSGGLYHEKIGVFEDVCGNLVSFSGSANETWMGWSNRGNYESFEVFCNWIVGEHIRTSDHLQFFDDLWNGKSQIIDVVDFPDVEKRKLSNFGHDDLDDFFTNQIIIPKPKASRALMKHQVDALSSWEKAGYKGILEHATGSGKTLTAIEAIRCHHRSGKPVLVLVPSKLLLTQWQREIQSETPSANILLAGGGENVWRKPLRLHSHTNKEATDGCVVIATMQTASTDNFLHNVAGGDHLLVVVDEIHQIGSPVNSKTMNIKFGSCLGLSATPKRYGDEVGTRRILDTYGPVLQPKVTLQDAIASGRLVPYEYYPTQVTLSDAEATSWKKFSKKISAEVARLHDSGSSHSTKEHLKQLLIKRAAIVKAAVNKIHAVRSIFETHFKPGQRWLVYCENSNQLQDVRVELNGLGLNPLEYHSKMDGDRIQTLKWFESMESVLLSIRCLDEGVDIPSVTHALILSSSQNPRQFIQRRGRVLRSSEDKTMAFIYDLVVLPPTIDEDFRSLVDTELRRAYEFACSCTNIDAITRMHRIGLNFGIDFDTNDTSEYEEIEVDE
jgi:superfamily II DNA or RNA helicase